VPILTPAPTGVSDRPARNIPPSHMLYVYRSELTTHLIDFTNAAAVHKAISGKNTNCMPSR
jgi:hypothetical protein